MYVCITSTNHRTMKISKETKDLRTQRRIMIKYFDEYKDLNNKRDYNTELINTIIENNKNMKILKTINI